MLKECKLIPSQTSSFQYWLLIEGLLVIFLLSIVLFTSTLFDFFPFVSFSGLKFERSPTSDQARVQTSPYLVFFFVSFSGLSFRVQNQPLFVLLVFSFCLFFFFRSEL